MLPSRDRQPSFSSGKSKLLLLFKNDGLLGHTKTDNITDSPFQFTLKKSMLMKLRLILESITVLKRKHSEKYMFD